MPPRPPVTTYVPPASKASESENFGTLSIRRTLRESVDDMRYSPEDIVVGTDFSIPSIHCSIRNNVMHKSGCSLIAHRTLPTSPP